MSETEPTEFEQYRAFIKNLNTARKRSQIFPPTHPFVSESLGELEQILEQLLENKSSFSLSIVDGEVYADGLLMADESLAYRELIDELAEAGLANLTFYDGLTVEELSNLISVSLMQPQELAEKGGAKQYLAGAQAQHIKLNEVTVAAVDAGGDAERREKVRVSKEAYRATVQMLVEVFGEASSSRRALDTEMLHTMVNPLMATVMESEEVALGLSTLKSFNEYTFFHSVNVAILSMLMGTRIGLDNQLLSRLGIAGLLHDVGKIKIPEEILDKPGKLTDEEFAIMKSHTTEGVKILSQQSDVDDLAPIIAGQHHAKYDLTGYPDFKGLGDIHILSHMVTIADVYDALTSDRNYRKTMLPDKAMNILIEGAGSSFHPAFLKVFVNLTGMFPVGSLVILDTGELGVVVKPNSEDIYRPVVKIVTSEPGPAPDAQTVDLTQTASDGSHIRTIVKSVDPADYNIEVAQHV